MFTLWGTPRRFCDKISRRDFLQVGAVGLGGLMLPDLLRLRAEAGTGRKHKSVIMICLAGGPSHIDMYDLKPNAPADIRGEFKPIKTRVPGFDICELMPLQAQIADKLALVRTVQFVEPMQHELEEVYTGFPKSAKRPCLGAVISRFGKGHDPLLPSYVTLDYAERTNSYESPRYLGAKHQPLPISGTAGVRNLGLPRHITRAKLNHRADLMRTFDGYRREMDARREGQNVDAYTARALDIIASPKARDAFDLSKEPDRLRERYGGRDKKYTYISKTLDSPWPGENFLLARRLVEAGVPAVTMRVGSWDHHGNVFSQGGNIWYSLRTVLPLLDRSIHALVTDLHDRGLDKDVLVLIWGEFGRTPKISMGGRDHWPEAGYALFAGGGLKTGQVVGETDSQAARPKNRGVGAQNILATVYHALGIDPSITVPDFSGRPMYLLDEREPVSELVN